MIWRAKGVEKLERERIGRLKWDNTDSHSIATDEPILNLYHIAAHLLVVSCFKYWILHIVFISSALRRVSPSMNGAHLIIISPVNFVDIIGFRFAMTRRRFDGSRRRFYVLHPGIRQVRRIDVRCAERISLSHVKLLSVFKQECLTKHVSLIVSFLVILDSHFCVN